MPCNHKFQNDLYLEWVDYEPTTLIVGTFNPEWPAGNLAEWFYGRTQNNNFWCVLPKLYEGPEASLIHAGQQEWKAFCKRQKIAITDLIFSIDGAEEGDPDHLTGLGNYADNFIANEFEQFTFVNVVDILEQKPSIKHVYLTRSDTGFWAELWQPIIDYAAANGITAQTLLTPSGNARFQHGQYNAQHPENPIHNLCNYILMRWQAVWHF